MTKSKTPIADKLRAQLKLCHPLPSVWFLCDAVLALELRLAELRQWTESEHERNSHWRSRTRNLESRLDALPKPRWYEGDENPQPAPVKLPAWHEKAWDMLAERAEAMTDEQVLAEAKAEGVDVAAEAAHVREVLLAAVEETKCRFCLGTGHVTELALTCCDCDGTGKAKAVEPPPRVETQAERSANCVGYHHPKETCVLCREPPPRVEAEKCATCGGTRSIGCAFGIFDCPDCVGKAQPQGLEQVRRDAREAVAEAHAVGAELDEASRRKAQPQGAGEALTRLTQERIARYEAVRECDKLRAELAQLTDEFSAVRASRDRLAAELDAARNGLAEKVIECLDLVAERDAARAETSRLEASWQARVLECEGLKQELALAHSHAARVNDADMVHSELRKELLAARAVVEAARTHRFAYSSFAPMARERYEQSCLDLRNALAAYDAATAPAGRGEGSGPQET